MSGDQERDAPYQYVHESNTDNPVDFPPTVLVRLQIEDARAIQYMIANMPGKKSAHASFGEALAALKCS